MSRWKSLLSHICLWLGIAAFCAAIAAAQPPTDQDAVHRGHAYARSVCGSCHEVEPGVLSSPYSKAPSFSVVAKTPGMTSMALNAWMHSAHKNMPILLVPDRDLGDLLAYFGALREAAKAASRDMP